MTKQNYIDEVQPVDCDRRSIFAFTRLDMEKHQLLIAENHGEKPGRNLPSAILKLILILLVGLCGSLFWILDDCRLFYTLEDSKPQQTSNFNLIKYAVTTSSAAPSTTAVLEVFQVYQPVLTPPGVVDETVSGDGSENTATISPTADLGGCQLLLMNHSFAYSYGEPFVGNYTPPNCKFNRVTMNFTVTSEGRQYDRLALMYFNDTEVFRTSTAEPTVNGIEWTYVKDMSEYLYIWNSPQTLIFDLGNLINDIYTAAYNTTLTATFFTAESTVAPADLIIPVSARNGDINSPSVFTLPSDNATNTVSFPRNVNRAVFSVLACGQATEEFWWGNVLQSDVETFEPYDGTLYGYSPFREVQILIDGQLAGVQWPFPIIFTGGVVPGLWRPIVGLDAFDLREHEIDITPWLPILCDGAEHTFEIRVAGIIDDGETGGTITETVGSSWYVTGKVFVWLDEDETSITTGKAPTILLPKPVITLSQSLTQNATGANETLTYTTNVKRDLSISSMITTQNGTRLATWTQSLTVTNYGQYLQFGAIQVNLHHTTGTDQSTGPTYYKSQYNYPVFANTTYLVQDSGNFTIDANVTRGLELYVQGTSTFPTGLQPFSYIPASKSLISGFSGSYLSTSQNGSAHYFASPSAGTSSGFGSTSQVFSFTGLDASGGVSDSELYYRDVEAVNGTVIKDYESLVGAEVGSYSFPLENVGTGQMVVGTISPKEAIGRGPGSTNQPLVQGG
ncbi:hypothetical protein B7494_g260 [Chlorociboria aeruginascens]|nr:hypothetical protein B7494_g260 [Chlorociboria aeruginascens]